LIPRLSARLFACLVFASLFCGCMEEAEPQPPEHLILVTLDTLRRDHLGTYGYEGAISPHLDRLAERGVRFDDAFTQAVTTPPSHASILTGLYPIHHGLRRLWGGTLAPSNQTLAEVLQEEGFVTAAFVSGLPLRSQTGLDQGFSLYDDNLGDKTMERSPDATNEKVAQWLDSRSQGRVFLWVHYFAPHAIYFPPQEYRDGVGRGDVPIGQIMKSVNANPQTGVPQKVEPAAAAIARDLYAAEVRYTDEAFGNLISLLEERDLLENAAVAVIADHGECLGEHGYFFGHWDVFDETSRVPLILAHPHVDWGGRSVSAPVGAIDLVPTLLAWLGIESPNVDGIDLTSLIEGGATPNRTIYTEQIITDLTAWAARDSRWSLRKTLGNASGEFWERELLGPDSASGESVGAARARLELTITELSGKAKQNRTTNHEVSDSVGDMLRALGYAE
jgi:arylsulfatase A-like enzyme